MTKLRSLLCRWFHRIFHVAVYRITKSETTPEGLIVDKFTHTNTWACTKCGRRWFKPLLLMFGFIALVLRTHATEIAWDINPDPETIGYKVYWGQTWEGYTEVFDTGPINGMSLENLTPGTYYFSVVAYNADGLESNFSKPLVICLPSNPYTGFMNFQMQASYDDTNWFQVGNLGVANEYPARFFRLIGDKQHVYDVIRIEESNNFFWTTCAALFFPFTNQNTYLRLQP